MNNKVLRNTGNINSKVFITDNKIDKKQRITTMKWIKKTSKQQPRQHQTLIKLTILINKSNDNKKQINKYIE